MAKLVFKLPSMHCLVPAPLTASLADVETVYNNECGKPLRIAHSEAVLRPKSIEKLNVNLALLLLHESTINALKQGLPNFIPPRTPCGCQRSP